MKEAERESGLSRFLKFLATEESLRFRIAVFQMPIVTGVGSFILNWLVFDKGFAYSVKCGAFVSLLVCFIGIVMEIVRRNKLR